jgi:Protein of unknown function (DUF732)
MAPSVARALASVSVLLTATVMCAGAASADPGQQDQFVSLLAQDGIPLMDNLPALVARAHQICGELNGGTPISAVVEEEMDGIYAEDPSYRQRAATRVKRTAIRFVAVSSEVYCPNHLADPLEGDLGNDVGFSTLGPQTGVNHQT